MTVLNKKKKRLDTWSDHWDWDIWNQIAKK